MDGDQLLTTTLFLLVVAITVGITFWASRQTKTAADFYSGGRSFSGFQNGLAIGGDYMSAASFLGISGAIALYGYDGFLYSIGFLVAWLVALLLVAEMLRNAGRYTMADQLAFRMSQRPVRTAASVSTVVVSIFYLLAQMVGAGTLVALLLGVDSQAVQNITIIGVGAPVEGAVVVLGELAGQRVEVGVGVAGVDGGQHERRDELQQAPDEGDVDVAEELGAHEVVGEHRHQDVEPVPGQERGRGGDDEAAVAVTQLRELWPCRQLVVDGVVARGLRVGIRCHVRVLPGGVTEV